jgi:hypothetical protein
MEKVGHPMGGKGKGVVHGDNSFWTTDIIKKLNYFNY